MSVELPMITAEPLNFPGIRHGFFTRQGGVSGGVYASLNGGVGSRDEPGAVQENRRRMAARLGVGAERFLVPYLHHSAEAQIVAKPWAEDARPRCDALVTMTPGLALGVTGADCGMLLFADAQARVIGAAHSGWKGALYGVLEATLSAMEQCGARRSRIHVVLGPMIGATSYEVGPEFMARFVEAEAGHARFFAPSGKEGHSHFDLPGFIGARLAKARVGHFTDLALDTYSHADRFYSYRRMTHRGEGDYGRLVSAIALAE
ncbi:MAG: polyphenol oxidase family protein [Hyphomicrobiales bacterium]|nr:polyphenol oxidase family protein [Hyphomicrobiales bacterium]MDE2115463.1 polyphenol oxidase family protein [Hyphomicrobiales bacterium]